jgi:16S rRNA (guanine(966)-N(2))-methyltransferase RsmD
VLHILAGRFRGRKLLSPPGLSSRPTLSRVRQALFNILAARLFEAEFLDLYAGVGTMGLEAYSQGCRRVVLVESERVIVPLLKENCRRLDPTGIALRVQAVSAPAAAARMRQAGERFDLIFLDPPYGGEALGAWEHDGLLAALLQPRGLLILQHGLRDAVPDPWSGLRRVREKTYGKTRFSFFERV